MNKNYPIFQLLIGQGDNFESHCVWKNSFDLDDDRCERGATPTKLFKFHCLEPKFSKLYNSLTNFGGFSRSFKFCLIFWPGEHVVTFGDSG